MTSVNLRGSSAFNRELSEQFSSHLELWFTMHANWSVTFQCFFFLSEMHYCVIDRSILTMASLFIGFATLDIDSNCGRHDVSVGAKIRASWFSVSKLSGGLRLNSENRWFRHVTRYLHLWLLQGKIFSSLGIRWKINIDHMWIYISCPMLYHSS